MLQMLIDLFKNFYKYLIEGLGVAAAVYLVRGRVATLQEIVLIGLTSAVSLLVLDLYAPSVAQGARKGSGYGLGLQLGNLPETALETPVVPTVPLPFEGFQSEINQEQSDAEMKLHYNKDCCCQPPCKYTCKATNKCELNCPTADQLCIIPGDAKVSRTNCSAKLIDGYYSKALLPGYNECVKAYNEF